jgi:hypothetical protein
MATTTAAALLAAVTAPRVCSWSCRCAGQTRLCCMAVCSKSLGVKHIKPCLLSKGVLCRRTICDLFPSNRLFRGCQYNNSARVTPVCKEVGLWSSRGTLCMQSCCMYKVTCLLCFKVKPGTAEAVDTRA